MYMGMEDYLLTSTIAGVLAQRLVRSLCVACRRPADLLEFLQVPATKRRDGEWLRIISNARDASPVAARVISDAPSSPR